MASSNSNQLKPCSICNGESCIMIPSISNRQYFCLLHYYSTGQHRSAQSQASTSISSSITSTKKKSTSLFVESQRMNKQLPNVQELFAEAFIDLQKEIGEESARSFQSASMSEDPLAALLDQTASSSHTIPRPSFRKQKSRNSLSSTKKKKKSTSSNDDMEGGFIRETQLPERLRKLQNPQTFASKYGASPPISKKQKQQSTTTIPNNNTTATAKSSSKSNPYQRKQTQSTNVWNQILDNPTTKEDSNGSKKKKAKKMNFADLEREMIDNITSGSMASTKTCTCGSTNVKIDGNVSNRNNDMMKGEVWGNKDRSETFERCHCLSCGRTWNDQD